MTTTMATTNAPKTPTRKKKRGKASDRTLAVVLGGGFIVVGLIIWQLAASLGLINTFLASSPALMAEALYNEVATGILLESLRISGYEFLIGFSLAAVVGVTVGLAMGRYWLIEYTLDPYVWLLYSSPTLALFPLMVLVFGLGTPAVIFMTFLLSVVPIIVNSSQGVRNVDKQLVQAAVSFGAGEFSLLTKVVLPASVPTIMAGIRLGLGRALVGVIVGEFFAGDGGIGFNINHYASTLETSRVLGSVVVVVVIGLTLYFLARRLEAIADSWRVDAD